VEAIVKRRILSFRNNERGQIVVFTLLAVLFLLAAGGLAVDFAQYFALKYELQRSMDAAALAGSGKLGFDASAFGPARTMAQTLAFNNASRYGTVDLTLNAANDVVDLSAQPFPYGDIVLGRWDPSKTDGVGAGLRFEPTLDSTKVNAVYCRYQRKVPTLLFGIWGLNGMNVAAHAIATAFPPNAPPPPAQGCMVPFALSGCFFGGNTSAGCGATISFISSSANSEVGANSGAWVNLTGPGNPSPNDTMAQINAAAGGGCPAYALKLGDTLSATNGMEEKVFNDKDQGLMTVFPAKYAASSTVTVYGPPKDPSDPSSPKPIMYQGKGWETYVPVLDTGGACPPGAINGSPSIVGFTRFVIAQVSDKNGECAVANHWTATQYSDGTSLPDPKPNPWDPLCLSTKNGTVPPPVSNLPSGVAANRGIYGYFDCGFINSPPSPLPGPVTALSPKHQLVK
jgi:Putative Flp pilus-assembly TadE/G-like